MARVSFKKQERINEVKGYIKDAKKKMLDMFNKSLNCTFFKQLPKLLVTNSCQKICLKCFQKWMGKGNKECEKLNGLSNKDSGYLLQN